MRGFKLRLINAFFIYLLAVIVVSLNLYFYLGSGSSPYILVSFLFLSALFAVYLRWFFAKLTDFIKEQVDILSVFVEKGEIVRLKDPLFEDLYGDILLKTQEIKKIIEDVISTNNIVKLRINDVIYSFNELLDDYKKFNLKFKEMVNFISSISREEFNLEVDEKLQSFVTLTVEIGKFKEQLLNLVEKVKDIVNDYIVRTSEDIKNANMIIKGFLSFSENLVFNVDKITLFLNNLTSHSEKLMEEISKIEKHKNILIERVEKVRDNFDREKELFDEIVGVNRTVNDVFYQLKTLLLEVSNLNKKASLMSLNALIYASESSQEDRKFGTVAKELKKLVEEIDRKYTAIDTFFSTLMEKNNHTSKLLADYETVKVKSRVELSKIASDIDHLSHHTRMSKQSCVRITEPVEENMILLNSIKEGVVNHSTAIKEVLIVFKDYLAKLDKAEKDREAFDTLVVATSGLLDYINNTLPAITNYVTELLNSLEDFSAELNTANKVIEEFNNDRAIKDFGRMLDELQHKRLANLKNSIVLLEKAKNIKKIL